MKQRYLQAILSVAVLLAAGAYLVVGSSGDLARAAPDRAHVAAALQSAPVMFIENAGQFSQGARFQVRGGDHTLWLAEDALWITVLEPLAQPERENEPLLPVRRAELAPAPERHRGVALKLSFVGANPHPRLKPFNRLDTHVSSFIGKDASKWRADLPVWGGVRYKDLYPGIDLEVAGENGRWQWRLVARPDANLDAVRLRVEGAEDVTLGADSLLLATDPTKFTVPLLTVEGDMLEARPSIFNLGRGTVEVTSPFAIGLSLATSITQTSNVSELGYATYLGGSYLDKGNGIALDASGAAYVVGRTGSTDFPTTPGAFDTTFNGGADVFVAKLNPDGSGLVYATFLGGSSNEKGNAIALDGSGAAYVTGQSWSSDFPTTPGAFNTPFPSGYYGDAFVAKLSADGTVLVYSTVLGGADNDYGIGIAVSGNGMAYVTGITRSPNFPTTPGAFDTTFNGGADAFIVNLNANGSDLVYATYLGGSDTDWAYNIALDASGAAYVVGRTGSTDFPTTPGAFDTTFNGGADVFVAKLNPDGSGLVYATLLGGSNVDHGASIVVDASGAAYVTGSTGSTDFPTTPGAFDTTFNGWGAFVAKVNANGAGLVYATFLDGTVWGWDITVDGNGAAYVVGSADSTDFPTTPGAFDTSHNGRYDVFVTKFTATGSQLAYSTFLGGAEHDCIDYTEDRNGCAIALSGSGVVYVTGNTYSPDFPTTSGTFDRSCGTDGNCNYDGLYRSDAFVAKLVMEGGPVEDIGFRPNPDGYSFANYGGVNYDDYTTADMRRMFGDAAVCRMVGSLCLVKPAALKWNVRVNWYMNGGHCDGFTTTSLRFFKGLDNPADFQGGANTTHDLQLGNARRHIAYYWVLQVPNPVAAARSQGLQKTPSQVLDQLHSAMSDGATDPTTLLVYNTARTAGHSITPYAIEDRDDGIYWVWVYDNNHPDDANRYVVINTTNDTWSYNLGSTTWSGDANTHTLGIVPISKYAQQPVCPWCNGATAGMLNGSPSGQIWLTGEGHLLMTDSQGRRIGYVGDQFVNEVPGAFGSVPPGGLGIPAEPIYTLPLTETYTILLDGQTLTQTETVGVTQFGPGYAVSVDDVTLEPTSQDELIIGPDGTQLAYRSDDDEEATLTLAMDSAGESHELQVNGADIGAGQVVTLTADVANGQLVFDDSQASGGTYDLEVTRISGAGRQEFVHAGVVMSATDTHYADYGAWEGAGPMTLYIDHDSDGTIDETLVLDNEAYQLSNGSFERGPRIPVPWRGKNLSLKDGRVCKAAHQGRCSFRVVGTRARKSLRQVVRIPGNAGDTFTLRGWSKARNPLRKGGPYCLQARVFHTDGTRKNYRACFTKRTHTWQRRRKTFTTVKEYNKIVVFLLYHKQGGRAWFDNVRLVAQ